MKCILFASMVAMMLPATLSRTAATPAQWSQAHPGDTGHTQRHSIRHGVDVNIHDRNIGVRHIMRAFALIRGTGARYVRVGTGGWGRAEPEPGVYDFRPVDRLIRATRSRGLDVLLEVGGNVPAWDLPAGANPRHGFVTYAPADCTGAANGDGSTRVCAPCCARMSATARSISPAAA